MTTTSSRRLGSARKKRQLQFRPVEAGATDLTGAGDPLPFWVIGSDQGLASEATQVDTLVFEPGGRYDIVFDFAQVPRGTRVIMSNEGWDAPFGGEFGRANATADDLFPDSQTDRIMAFDVVLNKNHKIKDRFDPGNISLYKGGHPSLPVHDKIRKVALFEGKDEFGRLQPLLGTVDDVPNEYDSIATPHTWANPDTELPDLDSTEIWHIYNFTGDAHPVHLHLVHFEILGRAAITFDSDDVDTQPVTMHNGTIGMAPRINNIEIGDRVKLSPVDGYVENAPKDMVTALPEQITAIKATFDKPGKYVWHCHILSHEDHEMMRVMPAG